MANTSSKPKAEAKAKAKAERVRDARHPYREGCNGQDAWLQMWPKIRAGKPVTMADVVSAWEKVIAAKGLATTGNTQSAKARAGQFVTGCLADGVLAHTEVTGVYCLGPNFPLPKATNKKDKATPPTVQAEAPTTAEGTE